jgi:rod shape-determining protein MreC
LFQLFANRRFLIIALIFLLITWVLFVTSHERAKEGKVEYFFNTAMAPLESIFDHIGWVAGDSWKTLTRLTQLKVNNDRLRAELDYLKARQIGLDSLKSENLSLREALKFQADQPHEMVSAEIISINPSNWNRTIVINKGRNFGLRKNLAVITSGGVAGRVGEVRANTAEVVLITDPREGNFTGGVVKRTKSMVIITGGGGSRGECTVQPAVDSYFSDLKINDLILTAETSEIFPRGLPIGKIVYIRKGSNNMVTKAFLKPVVDLGSLKVIYIIKTKKDSPIKMNDQSGGSASEVSNP